MLVTLDVEIIQPLDMLNEEYPGIQPGESSFVNGFGTRNVSFGDLFVQMKQIYA